MKKFLLFCIIILGVPIVNVAQNINGRFSSSYYSFERAESADISNTYIRSYQMLNLNVNKGRYSLRSYINFESDILKKISYDPRVRFYHLYLEARNLYDIATIKLGRQPIINSVLGTSSFDGVSVGLKYWNYKISGFYGGNVPAYQKFDITDDWNNNIIYGGKATARFMKDFQVDLSYVNKNFKSTNYATRFDSVLNPIQVLIETRSNQYRLGRAEVSYDSKNNMNVNARYEYDFNFMTTSKFELSGRYDLLKDLGFNIYYNWREPRIRYNSIFSVFDYGNSQEIEGGLDYRINSIFTAIGKFGYVKYKTDHSGRATAGINSNYGSLIYRKTFGYAGELDAITAYTSYPLFENLITPSIGLSYTAYKLSQSTEKNNLTSLLVGMNYRPWKLLTFDLQGQYMDNKLYKNDLRVFFKINYWFNTNLNLM